MEMKHNVFSYEGERGDLIEIFYKQLMTGDVISYEKVLAEYDGGALSVVSPTKHASYKTLKKVVPEVVETLLRYGYQIVIIPKGRNTEYQYVGADKDPLKNIRFKALLQERYDTFNIAIEGKSVLRFVYWPFNRGKLNIVFHPHIVMEYNGRLFSIGVSEMENKNPFRRYVIALDRINGEIHYDSSSTSFIQPMVGEYSYLSNLVGVTFEEGATLTAIVLRAHDPYTFGRLVTKPLHDSQRILNSPNWKEGKEYGDVEITVFPNKELMGQILSYGSMLEVIGPKNFRNRLVDELTLMNKRYNKR